MERSVAMAILKCDVSSGLEQLGNNVWLLCDDRKMERCLSQVVELIDKSWRQDSQHIVDDVWMTVDDGDVKGTKKNKVVGYLVQWRVWKCQLYTNVILREIFHLTEGFHLTRDVFLTGGFSSRKLFPYRGCSPRGRITKRRFNCRYTTTRRNTIPVTVVIWSCALRMLTC